MKKRILIAVVVVLALAATASLVWANGFTIDGTLSTGEWDGCFWFTDNSEGPGTGYNDDPLPVFTGYLCFDDTNLYLAFDVQDTTPNTNRDFLYVTIDKPTAGVFNVPVDALYWGSTPPDNPSFFGEAYLTGDAFPWDRSQRGSTWGTVGGVETARTITATNRYYELMIPLTAIGASWGDTIGLKIQARGGQYLSATDPQVVNYYPNMPDGITPIRSDTRVEVEGNFALVTLADLLGPITSNVVANPNPAPADTPVTVTATVDDTTTGGSDIASAEYTLDGGLTYEPMSAVDIFDSPIEAVTATFPVPNAGVYDLCVHGKDAAGNTGPDDCIFLAVYDPEGGFVTGGGWIWSPVGAYVGTTLEGKATFGFVSKYQKGANVPTGQTQFQFHVANFNFHSTSYQWLVVAGAKAQYKGSGTVNGIPGYGFLLTATDGQINGGGGVDKFRIKIWDSGGVIYDNVLGALEDIDAADPQDIAGGSIVIHKK